MCTRLHASAWKCSFVCIRWHTSCVFICACMRVRVRACVCAWHPYLRARLRRYLLTKIAAAGHTAPLTDIISTTIRHRSKRRVSDTLSPLACLFAGPSINLTRLINSLVLRTYSGRRYSDKYGLTIKGRPASRSRTLAAGSAKYHH